MALKKRGAWKRRRGGVEEKKELVEREGEPRRAFPPRTPCLEPLPTPPTHTQAPFSRGFVVKKKKKRHHHLSAGKKNHVRIEQGKCIRFSIAFIHDSIFSLEDSFPPNQPMTSRVCIYSPVDPGRSIKS